MVPILILIHSFISFLVYRLENERLKEFVEKTSQRSSTLLIVLYAQIATMLTVYQLIIVIEYLINYDHFLGKIAAYSLIGTGILMGTIHAGYMYAILQKRVEYYFPEVPEHMASTGRKLYRLCIFLVIFVFGLLLYPFLLIFF